MKIYQKTNKILKPIFMPLLISAIIVMACELLTLCKEPARGDLLYVFDEMIASLRQIIPFIFAFFLPYFLTDGKKTYNALWSVLCLAVAGGAFEGIADKSPQFFFGILIGILCAFVFSRFDMRISLFVTMVLSLLLGLLAGYIYNGFEDILIWGLRFIGNRGSITSLLFGFFNNLFSLVSDDFAVLAYTKSYGGAQFIDGTVVSGAKNIYELMPGASPVYTYLSGKYLMLFSVIGMTLAISDEFKGVKKYALWALAACSVISGNLAFFMIFVLLQSPFLFLYSCVLSALSYFAGALLKLESGFIHGGGMIEMFANLDRAVILIASGVAVAVISYFVFRYGVLKYDIAESENKYVPERFLPLIEALGGIHNIIKLKENGAEVRNVKLIDTIKLDGEIKENVFLFKDERLIEMMDYI